mmetsp:Transcript_71962/g.153885  ORF Transcript_71962/g.153885 Transcript_71962/m.153885 type:complete len:228 (-) Transcript_71962:1027-1710(-)
MHLLGGAGGSLRSNETLAAHRRLRRNPLTSPPLVVGLGAVRPTRASDQNAEVHVRTGQHSRLLCHPPGHHRLRREERRWWWLRRAPLGSTHASLPNDQQHQETLHRHCADDLAIHEGPLRTRLQPRAGHSHLRLSHVPCRRWYLGSGNTVLPATSDLGLECNVAGLDGHQGTQPIPVDSTCVLVVDRHRNHRRVWRHVPDDFPRVHRYGGVHGLQFGYLSVADWCYR